MIAILIAAAVIVLGALVVGYDLYTSNRLKKRLAQGGAVRSSRYAPATDSAVDTAQVQGHTHGMGNGGFAG
jgi:hypothetical protein